jgi:hypothetical protein
MAKKKHDLEPIDIYGNWKVTRLRFPRTIKHGLTEGVSTFKIRNKGARHVLIKKEGVPWNGDKTEIPLFSVPKKLLAHTLGFRLQATVKSGNQTLVVLFGSKDSGESLRFDIRKMLQGTMGRPHAGSFGTAGRGG